MSIFGTQTRIFGTEMTQGIVRRIGVDVVTLSHQDERHYREVVAYYGYPKGPVKFVGENGECTDDERGYFIPAEQMLKLSGGNVTATAIAKAIRKAGFLIEAPGNNNLWPNIPDVGKIKHYRVSGVFFHEVEPMVAAVAAE